MTSIGLETAVVVLRVAGEVLASAALAQADAAETAQRVTDDDSTRQAAAGMAGAGQAQQQQQQQQPTSADVLRQTNAQAQHDPSTSNLHAELPSNVSPCLSAGALSHIRTRKQLSCIPSGHRGRWLACACATQNSPDVTAGKVKTQMS